MSGSQQLEGLDGLILWAEKIIESRPPDFIIGDNYLRRWWVIPRNKLWNVYLHEINLSDDERAFHDHPWENVSILLRGSYIEHTPEGVFSRQAGEIIRRPAEALHRLEVEPGAQVLSLFVTGPVVREWGFDCPQGWRHWKEFTAYEHDGTSGKIGRGCD